MNEAQAGLLKQAREAFELIESRPAKTGAAAMGRRIGMRAVFEGCGEDVGSNRRTDAGMVRDGW